MYWPFGALELLGCKACQKSNQADNENKSLTMLVYLSYIIIKIQKVSEDQKGDEATRYEA